MFNIKNNIDLIFLGILNPILYFINPIFLLVGIVFDIIVISKKYNDLTVKIWNIYFLLSLYFGVDILGFKLYDLFIIIITPLVIVKFNSKLSKAKYNHLTIIFIFILYLSLLMIFKLNINGGYAEYFRYIISFLTIFVLYFTVKELYLLNKIVEFLPIIALKNIVVGITISLLINTFNMSNSYSSKLYNVYIAISDNEFRMTGFFSDPNKYFTYFIFLMAIYEIYNSIYSKKRCVLDKYNIIFILGALLSFSRTSIITIVIYFTLKTIYIRFFYYNDKAVFDIVIFLWIILLFVIIMLFNKYIVQFIDIVIQKLTIMMGREESLIYSGTVASDSRIISSQVALNSIKNSLLTGKGLYYWKNIYYMPPHNTIVTIIQDTGIIGLIMYCLFISYGIKNIPVFITLSLVILPMLFFDLQNYRILYITIGVAMLRLNNNIKLNN